jgi:hypothetical protein
MKNKRATAMVARYLNQLKSLLNFADLDLRLYVGVVRYICHYRIGVRPEGGSEILHGVEGQPANTDERRGISWDRCAQSLVDSTLHMVAAEQTDHHWDVFVGVVVVIKLRAILVGIEN